MPMLSTTPIMPSRVPLAKLRALIALRRAVPPLTTREIAATLGVTERTVRRWWRRIEALKRENPFA
jgi:predicted transcriptional regulator